jgi:Sec-independent protein translocase protein TatA
MEMENKTDSFKRRMEQIKTNIYRLEIIIGEAYLRGDLETVMAGTRRLLILGEGMGQMMEEMQSWLKEASSRLEEEREQLSREQQPAPFPNLFLGREIQPAGENPAGEEERRADDHRFDQIWNALAFDSMDPWEDDGVKETGHAAPEEPAEDTKKEKAGKHKKKHHGRDKKKEKRKNKKKK